MFEELRVDRVSTSQNSDGPLRLIAIILFLALTPLTALANLDEYDADRLVRSKWFEGIPASEIDSLSAGAVQHLASLLAEPGESVHHAAIIELLGRAGGPGAYEVVAAHAAAVPSGEVDGDAYRSRVALPIALGYLARSDDRALRDLLAAARDGRVRGWRHRNLDGARVGSELRLMAVSGLGLSGRSAARALLEVLGQSGRGGGASGGSVAPHAIRQHSADTLSRFDVRKGAR